MDCKECCELLPLSIDRELDARTEGALSTHLESCAACDRRREQLADLVAGIRSVASYHRAPDLLRQGILASLPFSEDAKGDRKTSAWRIGWWLLNGGSLAAAICVALVLALVWPRPSGDPLMVDELIASHARSLLTDHVMDIASSDQHTVKPWFSGKLDFSPPVRDFAEQGFPLLGGRLDYLDRHPVAVLVYRHRQHVIEVFVWPVDGNGTAMMTGDSQGFHVLGWSAAGLSFRAVSDVDAAELDHLAELIR